MQKSVAQKANHHYAGSDSNEPSFVCVSGCALSYRMPIKRDCRRIPGTLTCCCIVIRVWERMHCRPTCTGANKLRIGRIPTRCQNAVLEIRRARGGSQKGGKCQRGCTTDTQTPNLIRRLACSHLMLERSELVMGLIPSSNRLSKTVSDGCSAHGTQRRVCISRGTLNDDRSRMRAS